MKIKRKLNILRKKLQMLRQRPKKPKYRSSCQSFGKTVGVMATATAFGVVLSVFAVMGLSVLGNGDISKSFSEENSRFSYSLSEDSGIVSENTEDYSEESYLDDSKILIHSVDLSQCVNGIQENVIANISGHQVDEKRLLTVPLPKLNCDGSPEVLIYHTHASESYAEEGTYTDGETFLSEDDDKNMVFVGEAFAQVLRANGIGVIHDTYHHSSDGYNQAYSSSAKSLEEILKNNPTVKIAIDMHRDAIVRDGAHCRPLTYVEKSPAAQIMLVVGGRNGKWEQNLALAYALQAKLNSDFPTLARPIYFSKGEYNQSMFEGAMLFEVGASGNMLEDAVNTAKYTAEAFCKVFCG